MQNRADATLSIERRNKYSPPDASLLMQVSVPILPSSRRYYAVCCQVPYPSFRYCRRLARARTDNAPTVLCRHFISSSLQPPSRVGIRSVMQGGRSHSSVGGVRGCPPGQSLRRPRGCQTPAPQLWAAARWHLIQGVDDALERIRCRLDAKGERVEPDDGDIVTRRVVALPRLVATRIQRDKGEARGLKRGIVAVPGAFAAFRREQSAIAPRRDSDWCV